ncbi:MAG: gamma-glutamyl-gamma-aminobutyrate hydrolase family protein [Candidatus Adiutrix sp.]|nr:gamma-glutamyl-gamma-aminobutyrate hydrolase family protein [Candidatus Adiutrix sp.]
MPPNEKKTLLGLTQRVTVIKEVNEKRDSLAQDWGRFMAAAGLPWVALPNRPEEAAALAERLDLGGLVLTGGDDLGLFPERDETELRLLDWAESAGRPVAGVCRGFQMIQTWLKGELRPVDQLRHVRTRHRLILSGGGSIECNSFHGWGIMELPRSLNILARCADDQTIEAAGNERLLGLMWHPERELKPVEFDLELFARHFAGDLKTASRVGPAGPTERSDWLTRLQDPSPSQNRTFFLAAISTDKSTSQNENSRDMRQKKKMEFGSKAETLGRLQAQYPEFGIAEMAFFTVGQWRQDQKKILKELAGLPGDWLAVRSSALCEDTHAESNAGAFLSILGVGRAEAELAGAVERVIDSLPGDEKDQVLIQTQIEDIEVSGVIFTRCLDDGAPYYVINYDDESGATDRVTGGTGVSKTVHVFRDIDLEAIRSPRIRRLVEMARELEEIFHFNALDIEFGLGRDGRRHVFQVRPLSNIARWPYQADQIVSRNFDYIESFFAAQCGPKPGVFGRQAILGVMPDWNPAEMIGILPRPLATSLYRELITRDVWRRARELMGYRPLEGELMAVMAGRPYIDVRQSFNSFLPPGLPDEICEAVVNAWLGRLHDHPELHDKVEFAVAATCLDFSFKEAWRERYQGLLSPQDEAAFENALRAVTLAGLRPESSLEAAEADIALLEARQQNRRPETDSLAQKLAWINYLLQETSRYGTLPFSVLARHAFIAESLLRSAVARGALAPARVGQLKMSIKTVAGQLADELGEVLRGEAGAEQFFIKYGHLRPSSYDILSPRYADRPEILALKAPPAERRDDIVFAFTETEEKALTALLREAGFDSVAPARLSAYIRRAIAGREYAKFVFTRNVSQIIELAAELGRSMEKSREDMSFLNILWLMEQGVFGRLQSFKAGLDEHIEENKRQFEVGRALRLPYLLTSPRDLRIVPQHRSAPNFIAFRRVAAPVAYLSSTSAFSGNLAGHIICIENADPGFDWIFSQPISGLVTKFGGANSHMAVRCSEHRLPAAIGCGEKLFEAISKAERAELDPVNKILRPVGDAPGGRS